jgi:glycerol uptake facilitator-like aquaporin
MPRRRAPSWAAGRNRRRRLLAEFTGTGLLVAVVVGSGIAATGLTADAALRLLINSLVTALGLAVLILVFARPVARTSTPTYAGIAPGSAPAFIAAQVIGAAIGRVLAVTVHPVSAAPADTPVQLAG